MTCKRVLSYMPRERDVENPDSNFVNNRAIYKDINKWTIAARLQNEKITQYLHRAKHILMDRNQNILRTVSRRDKKNINNEKRAVDICWT